MKKIVALALTLVLSFSTGITAFAASITPDKGSGTASITATYKQASPGDTVYSVDVQWGSMNFAYSTGGKKVWDAVNHIFKIENGTSEWICDKNADKITVTNNSNTEIIARFSYEPIEEYKKIGGSFDKQEITLASAVGTSKEASPTDSTTLELNGALSEDASELVQIGSVKVTINDLIPKVILETENVEFFGKNYNTDVIPSVKKTGDNLYEITFQYTGGEIDGTPNSYNYMQYVKYSIKINGTTYYIITHTNSAPTAVDHNVFAKDTLSYYTGSVANLTSNSEIARTYLGFGGKGKYIMKLDTKNMKITDYTYTAN